MLNRREDVRKMLTQEQVDVARGRAREYYARAGIVITPDEAALIEVADFGLGELETIGLELITYVNTDRVCAKELVLFPRQTCPEHRHPPVSGEPGKEETFRCRWGEIYLYTEGEPVDRNSARAKLPSHREDVYTVWREIVLRPGEQYTLPPNTLHWFQSGDQGAVISEFSTRSRDESDFFTDPEIRRATVVV